MDPRVSSISGISSYPRDPACAHDADARDKDRRSPRSGSSSPSPAALARQPLPRLSAAPPPSSLAGNHFADLESLTDSRHVTGDGPAMEVTLSRNLAKSRKRGRKLPLTEAKARVGRARKTRAELEH